MEKYTAKELSALIEAKLQHNLGVEPEQASNEMFYKATVLAVLDIMKNRRVAFKNEYKKQESKQVYYLSM